MTLRHDCSQVDLSRYSLPTYMRIVTYKTAFYSFYLPVACGLLIGGARRPGRPAAGARHLRRDGAVFPGEAFTAEECFASRAGRQVTICVQSCQPMDLSSAT